MNILHLNSNLNRSKIHSNIVESLNNLEGVDGRIFFPTEIKHHYIEYNESYIDKVKCINRYERFFYFHRNNHLLKVSSELYKKNNFTHILAHSLFSNGKLAMDLSKKLGIPYSVIVTNTDVNKYFKKMIHLRKTGESILENASSVIFTSSSYKERVLEKYISVDKKSGIDEKSSCIPFGIEDFWIDNRQKAQKDTKNEIKQLLYVGKINKNKNLIFLADSIEKLNNEKNKEQFVLTIVGDCENSKDEKIKQNLIKRKYVKIINFADKEKLLNYYRAADVFIMISKTESFGLVYAEAMTQGLPIVYTKNEGFDKQFKDYLVGIPVNPKSYFEIKEAINHIENNYKELSYNAFEHSEIFLWENIAIRFKDCLLTKKDKVSNKEII
ncbi:glycosyltransferase [Exiguobacterium antarcticum]|uniref:Glycosyltransferase n=1 Tax=Exiguobacterium antarcticum TaxID=132920 RepID=A0ABT6R642_9BACL|nr:glycosyltransferase [Exiguobacterium antarcticum]MDI3236268.1 glycosyltransferase [Exiguobacterium antarcticum]